MSDKLYRVRLTGLRTLLMHADNIDGADIKKAWQDDRKNKNVSVPGDDRTPVWGWKTCLWWDEDDGVVAIPWEAIVSGVRKAGASVKLRGKTTFKSEAVTGMSLDADFWPLRVLRGKKKEVITTKEIDKVSALETFREHQEAVLSLGFKLHVRRAAVGTSKHVRVRPAFPAGWETEGVVRVHNTTDITKDVLQTLFTHAGTYSGIGDWRPSAPKSPGPYGKFTAVVEPE